MTDLYDISVGWVISERAPDESDYEPRGGHVVAIRDLAKDGTEDPALLHFTTLKIWRGQLKRNELRGDQVDASLAVRPSLQQQAVLIGLLKAICTAAGKGKFSEYQRWLIGAAYRLSEHIR